MPLNRPRTGEIPERRVESDAVDLEALHRRCVAERAKDGARYGTLGDLEVAEHLVVAEESERVALRKEEARELREHLPEEKRSLEVERFAESRRHVGAPTDEQVVHARARETVADGQAGEARSDDHGELSVSAGGVRHGRNLGRIFRRGQCKARIGGLTDHLVLVLLVPLQSSHLRHIPRRESWKPS